MSWALSAHGNVTGLQGAIDREQSMPAPIKDAIKAIVTALPDNPKRTITLETNGHVDTPGTDYAGGNVTIKIGSVQLLTE